MKGLLGAVVDTIHKHSNNPLAKGIAGMIKEQPWTVTSSSTSITQSPSYGKDYDASPSLVAIDAAVYGPNGVGLNTNRVAKDELTAQQKQTIVNQYPTYGQDYVSPSLPDKS